MAKKSTSILSVGDKAPAFSLKNQDGTIVRLKDFAGKKVVVYFYPKDNTPTCTKEACNLRNHYQKLKKKGYEVIGVSTDSENSHRRFREKFDLPFDLLADTEKEMVNAYRVYGEKMLYGRKYMGILRTTFLIDERGRIERIIDDVDAARHAEQILNTEE
jgi:peroxiredoxin Q/BCP